MAEVSSQTTGTADREIVIARRFDAPRELVWQAWTEPEHLIQWWGPNGFTNTFHEIDVRPGGVWRFVMHGPDGTDYDNFSRFIEVVRLERIVFDHGASENDVMFRSSVTFEQSGGGTDLTLRMVFPTREQRDAAIEKYGAIEGGNQTLGRLGEHLKTM
jgi:uncharacterized protein YndB with AHSA1/START domain